MKTVGLMEYYDTFINAAVLRGEAIKTGDSKTANRQYTILKRILMQQKHFIKISEAIRKPM
jgi:hypothetical protein